MFVVCGEALMDLFVTGETAAGLSLDARVGGSPFNVAVGLARLAQPVAFVGAISTGVLGQRLLRALREEGVETGGVLRTAAPTTLGLVGLDPRGVADYAFYGQDGAERQLEVAALDKLPAARRSIHVGSYAMVAEPVASTLRALIEREHARGGGGCVIAFDPNVRLAVEPDLARWRAALRWMLTRCDLLKISAEDLALLHPGQAPAALAAEWLAAGVGLVVLTRGAEGCRAWTRTASVEVAAVATEVIDTVGAGDSHQAALLCWLAEQGRLDSAAIAAIDAQALQAALVFAARAAALTCGRRGADLPSRDELP